MTAPTPEPLETPQAAYNRARALEQKVHTYTTKQDTGLADCACGVVDAQAIIGEHIEKFAEAAGNAAKDHAVVQAAMQYSKEKTS